jgi:hypothetical protein|tara:strand:+ start:608 stop:1066 length:459 start_codon:yes stop_codon:yes gene_type:complete
MKSAITFDLSLTEDGLFYDITFKGGDGLETIQPSSIKKEAEGLEDVISIKKKNVKLIQIRDNPLIEQCEEECDEGCDEDPSVFGDDFSDEEDTSIRTVYEEVSYITFPDMKSVYTEKDMEYVGELKSISCDTCIVDFTLIGDRIHKSSLPKN